MNECHTEAGVCHLSYISQFQKIQILIDTAKS